MYALVLLAPRLLQTADVPAGSWLGDNKREADDESSYLEAA